MSCRPERPARYRRPDVASSVDVTSGRRVAINNRTGPREVRSCPENLGRRVVACGHSCGDVQRRAGWRGPTGRVTAPASARAPTGYIRLAATQCHVVRAPRHCLSVSLCPSMSVCLCASARAGDNPHTHTHTHTSRVTQRSCHILLFGRH